MSKTNILKKIKYLFVEEVKPKKTTLEEKIVDENTSEKKSTENLQIKNLIEEIIEGNNRNKEDIIKALKHCEEEYYDEEKELEIIESIGNLKNDPEILKEFIKSTIKYSRFDGDAHLKIREKRNEIIKELNQLSLEEILSSEENTYKDKNNIIKVLNLIKNEQLNNETKENLKTTIIEIFNNINEQLYDDINILESLFIVLDNKMRIDKTEEIDKTIKDIKRKIDIYHNTPGTIEEKLIAMRQITINKIKEQEKHIQNEIKTDYEEKKENEQTDYKTILLNQENRIRNAKNKTEEEKQILIDELYKNFELFVGEPNYSKKTR